MNIMVFRILQESILLVVFCREKRIFRTLNKILEIIIFKN